MKANCGSGQACWLPESSMVVSFSFSSNSLGVLADDHRLHDICSRMA